MVWERFVDLYDDTGHFNFRGWRCLICGHVYDPVISANRKLHPAPVGGKKRKCVVGVN
jgi:hypothetical protein